VLSELGADSFFLSTFFAAKESGQIKQKSRIKLLHFNVVTSMRNRNTPASNKKLKWFRFFKRILIIFFIFIFCGLAAILLLIKSLNIPDAKGLSTKPINQTSIIYDRTGTHILYEIHGEENRILIPHDQIPNSMRIATVAAEDRYFYQHHGLDFGAIFRALKADLESNEMKQGGSTITQQLARNVFLSGQKSFGRKIAEAILAIEIEMVYSKDQILDRYLNEVPYGSNAYGVEAASETFFGKPAKDLTLDESAFLAALPKAPTDYSPYGNNKDVLVARQKMILNRIAELGLASQDEVNQALQVNTLSKVKPLQNQEQAPYFVDYIVSQLEQKYGKTVLETGGLRIYTTLDWNMEKTAEQTVADGAAKNVKNDASNAALVAVNPKNGEILAMVGGKDYYDQKDGGQFNVAIHPRQPGSAFKPFAYATAFQEGYQPDSILVDEPMTFKSNGDSGIPYSPRNYDGRFHGVVTMRQALAQSLNVPAVETLNLSGINQTIQTAHNLGITTLNDRSRYGLSLVLGGAEVSLLDMTGAYSVFANDGKKDDVHGVMKILDSHGQVFMSAQTNERQALDPDIARKINSILSDNTARAPIFGANSPLHLDGTAAKTGTTTEFRDGWTIGYTPEIAVGVWVGNNNNAPMKDGSDGVFVAAPIWRAYMDKIISNYNKESFTPYQSETKPNDNQDNQNQNWNWWDQNPYYQYQQQPYPYYQPYYNNYPQNNYYNYQSYPNPYFSSRNFRTPNF
jgi:1A family penicillin-binding protein